ALKFSFPSKMSSETATCPGCDHSFSLRGYQSHLALSRDPLCRAVFDKLKKANDAYKLLMSAKLEENSRSGAGSDADSDTVLFQGNAFGTAEDYASDTFGQTMDDNEVAADDTPPLMEVSDDEDDNNNEDDEEDLEMADMVAELEKSWEPPQEGAPHQEAMDNDVDADDLPPLIEVSDNEDNDKEGTPHQAADTLDRESVVDEGHTPLGRGVDQFIIGDGYGVKPAVRIRYNNKHPSARAGQPLTHEASRDHAYGAALGGGDNPWAPFNSKKDWEIARWAKLRGAGSTAFSELLAIDSVCFN
ncbi:hypothetical protein BYT27DRAFT_7092544, partial [Phlegmacium glaucopus]